MMKGKACAKAGGRVKRDGGKGSAGGSRGGAGYSFATGVGGVTTGRVGDGERRICDFQFANCDWKRVCVGCGVSALAGERFVSGEAERTRSWGIAGKRGFGRARRKEKRSPTVATIPIEGARAGCAAYLLRSPAERRPSFTGCDSKWSAPHKVP